MMLLFGWVQCSRRRERLLLVVARLLGMHRHHDAFGAARVVEGGVFRVRLR